MSGHPGYLRKYDKSKDTKTDLLLISYYSALTTAIKAGDFEKAAMIRTVIKKINESLKK